MLKGIIKLKNYKQAAFNCAIEINLKNNYGYNIDLIKKSLDYYIDGNLYYNTKTGKTYFKKEVYSEYSYKKDIPTYYIEELENIIHDQFIGFIMSGASRLHRGYNL